MGKYFKRFVEANFRFYSTRLRLFASHSSGVINCTAMISKQMKVSDALQARILMPRIFIVTSNEYFKPGRHFRLYYLDLEIQAGKLFPIANDDFGMKLSRHKRRRRSLSMIPKS